MCLCDKRQHEKSNQQKVFHRSWLTIQVNHSQNKGASSS
jgi:hypothetical protein